MHSARNESTVYRAFKTAAALTPEAPFVCVLAETARVYGIAAGEISYGQIAADVERLRAAYSAAGYVYGQRVGLLLENRPAFFSHWLALNAIGVSVVPINPDLRSGELEYLVVHSEMVAAVVIPQRQADIRAAAGERRVAVFGPDDAIPFYHAEVFAEPYSDDGGNECALLYTSGTTGRPKGCVLDNTYFLNNGRWYLDVGGAVTVRRGCERMLTPLPLFHMNAMSSSTMATILAGGCLIVLDRFHPKTWWLSVREARATMIHYLGVMPPMLMAAPDSAADRQHSVRFGFGAGVDGRLHAAFEARFGFPLVEAWAMTETGGGVIITAAHEPRHVGTHCFGKPGPEAEARVVVDDGTDAAPGAPGELLVRRAGPDPRHGFFGAYLKDREATEDAWRGGWFHTGDIVKRDADGNLYFVDRKKNVIRRASENISAVEVESVLMQHPGIAAVAVGAVADAVRGDEVFACVVPRIVPADAGIRTHLATAIVQHCLARLAYFKAPGFIAFVDALPVTATQKIQRGAMKDLIADLSASGTAIDTRHLKKRAG